jgi:hypothetical protein
MRYLMHSAENMKYLIIANKDIEKRDNINMHHREKTNAEKLT